jgi:hypothetical protein
MEAGPQLSCRNSTVCSERKLADAAVRLPLQNEDHDVRRGVGAKAGRGPGRRLRSCTARVVAGMLTLNLEAVKAGLPVHDTRLPLPLSLPLSLPPVVYVALNTGPKDLNVLIQLHRSLLV